MPSYYSDGFKRTNKYTEDIFGMRFAASEKIIGCSFPIANER